MVPIPASATQAIPPGRKLLFRFAASLLVPVLVLLISEVALRLGGFGHPTGFFQPVRIGSQDFLVHNESFSLRFFPPQLARWPGPLMLEQKKPANTFRIFVLGESAARGEPQPAYSAARYMEALLRERFPAQNFEVINLAITAINSHVVLPIAKDCAPCQGDIWLIYMGNNEMVGPFGAATVFGMQAPPRWFVRCYLALEQTRLGQGLIALGRKLRGTPANASWGGMKMFLGNRLPPDDRRKETVYRNFAKNLQDIVRTGLDSRAKVLLSTVAVNLADCPPFASMGNSNLAPAQIAQRDLLATEGAQAQARTDFFSAAQKLEDALQIDPHLAELEFQLGRCLLALTNRSAAHNHFQAACDLDALPFRADSRINGIIRETGRRLANPNLVLFDAAAALDQDGPAGVCGQETFYEHVHFNSDGNYRLGRAWADQVARILSPDWARDRKVPHTWASQESCEQRLGLTDWNRANILESVIWRLHRPPLSSQSNNSNRQAALEQERSEIQGRLHSPAQDAQEVYHQALARAPRDHWLHENFAEFLESSGDLKTATAEWQKICELLPFHSVAYFQAGRLLRQQNRWLEAGAALQQALALRPGMAEGWFELGQVNLALLRFNLALKDFVRAHQFEPQDPAYVAFIGKALSKLGRRAESIPRYREALALKPDLWEAHLALGDELAAANQLPEAQREYEEVARLQPRSVVAHLDLGVMLARQGLFERAVTEFDQTLQLDPANHTAQEYLQRVRDWQKQRAK